MAATYPGGIKSFTDINPGDQTLSTQMNQAYDEIEAIETALGADLDNVLEAGDNSGKTTSDLGTVTTALFTLLNATEIGTSLISDTDATDSLGSSAVKWLQAFINRLTIEEAGSTSTPASGDVAVYAKANGLVYSKDDAGTETLMSGGSGGGALPNVIINGNMDIWQRGTSFAAIAHDDYSADRFKYKKVGTMVHTASQSTDVPTEAESGIKSNYSLKLDCTTADAAMGAADRNRLMYIVEGYDYAPLKDNAVTLSFWVKAVKTGTYCIGFINNGSDRSYVVEYTIDSASTWEKKTITLTFDQSGGTEDYTNGAGLYISWTISAGTNFHTTADAWQNGNYFATANQVNGVDNTANDFYLAQVKLELGAGATAFVARPIGEELALCKRYFERFGTGVQYENFGSLFVRTVSLCLALIEYTEKRAAPTASVSAVNAFNCITGSDAGNSTNVAFTYLTPKSVQMDLTVAGYVVGEGGVLRAASTTTTIDIDAEL
jgi:hypothetical protein